MAAKNISEKKTIITASDGTGFCRGYFGMSHKCTRKECTFSHNDEEYLLAYQLNWCDTEGCTKFCKKIVCRDCIQKRQTKRDEDFNAKNVHRMGQCKRCVKTGNTDDQILINKKIGVEKPRGDYKNGKSVMEKMCMKCAGNFMCEWCEKIKTPYRLCRLCKDSEDQYTLSYRY
jgi:hypothetical protein